MTSELALCTFHHVPRWLLPLALSCGMCATSLASAGEPSASDKESARSLMKQGDEAMREDHPEIALERYRTAQSLVDVPTTPARGSQGARGARTAGGGS